MKYKNKKLLQHFNFPKLFWDRLKLIVHKIIKIIIDFRKWFIIPKDLFSIYLPLFVAFCALWISINSSNNSDKQFKMNIRISDSTFKIQVHYMDSLTKEIRNLQSITTRQSEIIEGYYKIFLDIKNDQLYEGRPILLADKPKLFDSIYYDNAQIGLYFSNKGKREALDIYYHGFLIIDNQVFSNLKKVNFIAKMLPENGKYLTFWFNIGNIKLNDFFFCYYLDYFDKTLNRRFPDIYFQHYTKELNGKYYFYICDSNDESKVRNIVNDYIKKHNLKNLPK
jgi:hypothetical protein